jgi:hypothetical protein
MRLGFGGVAVPRAGARLRLIRFGARLRGACLDRALQLVAPWRGGGDCCSRVRQPCVGRGGGTGGGSEGWLWGFLAGLVGLC